MHKIDFSKCPSRTGSGYPSPYDEPCRDRHALALGDAAGLSQFGVNLVRLSPGAWSSQRHWHAHEDEFVWVQAGSAVLVTDAGRETMNAGDCAGFKAGVRDGHHFVNESDEDVLLLVVGTRNDNDYGEYPDVDMRFRPARYSGGGGFETKKGEALE